MLGGKVSKFIAYPGKLSLKPLMSKDQVSSLISNLV